MHRYPRSFAFTRLREARFGGQSKVCDDNSLLDGGAMMPLSNMRGLPLVVVLLIIGVLWYVGAIGVNAQRVRDQLNQTGQPWTTADFIAGTWSTERPVLPTPDQILREFWKTTANTPVVSKRSLVYHGWITASATLLGFAFGTL